jgi:hypothetical protein
LEEQAILPSAGCCLPHRGGDRELALVASKAAVVPNPVFVNHPARLFASSLAIAVRRRMPYHHGVSIEVLMAIYFSRHARRQMKWRRVSEVEMLSVLDAPNRVDESIDGRRNAYN